MTRNKTLIAFGTALAITSTAALAQTARPGPDFSPLPPDNLRTEAPVAQTDTTVTTHNPMLDAYQSSNPLPNEPAAPPVATETYSQTYVETAPAPGHRFAIAQPAPRESTIGDGLFNRRGPNDFGA